MGVSPQERFMALYRPVHDNFERFCRARVYGEMEYTDLINETLLVAFQRMNTLRDESAFLSFLFSIAVKILANSSRKRRTESLSFQDGERAPRSAVAASAEQAMAVDELHGALAKLPKAQRESLILFEINGFSIKEIMEIQDAGESTVKQRLKRGREKLRKLLQDEPELTR